MAGVTLNYTQIYRASQGASSRLEMPVSAGNVLYAQFRHIRGVPAGPGDSAVPLDHLKVMDSLIAALHQRGIRLPKVLEESADPEKLMNHLQEVAKKPPVPYKAPLQLTGILLDMSA